jgi:Cu+-exporting ATPase
MRLFKKTCVLIAFATTLGSCGENHNHSHDEGGTATTELAIGETQVVDYAVDGMVCAMGCAATIQQEVADMDGVSISDVSYEDEKAHFEFDPAVTSEEAIKAKIATIADGQYVLSTWEEKEAASTEEVEEVEAMDETEGGEESMVKVSLPNFEIPNLFTLLLNQL